MVWCPLWLVFWGGGVKKECFTKIWKVLLQEAWNIQKCQKMQKWEKIGMKKCLVKFPPNCRSCPEIMLGGGMVHGQADRQMCRQTLQSEKRSHSLLLQQQGTTEKRGLLCIVEAVDIFAKMIWNINGLNCHVRCGMVTKNRSCGNKNQTQKTIGCTQRSMKRHRWFRS